MSLQIEALRVESASKVCASIFNLCYSFSELVENLNRTASLHDTNYFAPTSRKTILSDIEGPPLVRGSLLQLGRLNYDGLMKMLGDSDVTEPGVQQINFLNLSTSYLELEKTLKFLAKHQLIHNYLVCPSCDTTEASLVRYKHSPDKFAWRCGI